MSDRSEPTLVIDDGGLGSLLASLTAERRDRVMLWIPPLEDDPDRQARRRAVFWRRDLLGLAEVVEADRSATRPAAGQRGGLALTAALLSACVEAMHRSCSTVIWPVQHGDDLDAMAEAADRSRLLSHLAALDAGSLGAPGFRLRTPFLDLTDDQAADLAVELDAPLAACWWRQYQDALTPAARAEAARWNDAFRRIGADAWASRMSPAERAGAES